VRLAPAAAAIGLLLTPLASAAVDFGRPAEIPLARAPDILLVGDATQDAVPDIITFSWASPTIGVLPGFGDGSFERRLDYPGVIATRAAVLGDWDADGSEDLAVAASTGVTVFAGVDAGLARRGSYFANSPAALAAGDVDSDGNLDLVAASATGSTVSVLRGLGDGTFERPVARFIGSPALAVIVADFTGDDVSDIAAAGSDLSVLIGIGDGEFGQFASYPSGAGARSLDADDLDDDGDIDLVASGGANEVRAFLNTGEGAFPSLATFDAGGTPLGVTARDVDGDGRIDAVTANRSSDDISVLLGEGDGTFGEETRIKVGRAPIGLGVLDVDSDGSFDLITANRRSKSVTVLLNGTNAPQPTVCLVPRLVRRKLAVAQRLVAAANCRVGRVRRKYSNRVKRGRVIAVTPLPGTRLPVDTAVTLLVSRGPKR
jgi:FG-GAP-like repeat/PASTA domain